MSELLLLLLRESHYREPVVSTAIILEYFTLKIAGVLEPKSIYMDVFLSLMIFDSKHRDRMRNVCCAVMLLWV